MRWRILKIRRLTAVGLLPTRQFVLPEANYSRNNLDRNLAIGNDSARLTL